MGLQTGGQKSGGNYIQHPEGMIPLETRKRTQEFDSEQRRSVAERLQWPASRVEAAAADAATLAIFLTAEPRDVIEPVLQDLTIKEEETYE